MKTIFDLTEKLFSILEPAFNPKNEKKILKLQAGSGSVFIHNIVPYRTVPYRTVPVFRSNFYQPRGFQPRSVGHFLPKNHIFPRKHEPHHI
jgi:hypothetical protein